MKANRDRTAIKVAAETATKVAVETAITWAMIANRTPTAVKVAVATATARESELDTWSIGGTASTLRGNGPRVNCTLLEQEQE